MSIIKKNLWNIYIYFSLSFRQIAKIISKDPDVAVFLGGNVDPLYIFAPMFWINSLRNKKNIKKPLIVIFVGACFVLFQSMVIPNYNITKGIISFTKIVMCFSILLYAKDNYNKIDLNVITIGFTILILIQFIIAVTLGRQSIMWRFNDGINLFNLTRLQLFFLEPSELGYHIAIIVIIIYAKVLISKKIRISDLFLILSNLVVLNYAKPMGAIMFLVLALGVMAIYFVIEYTKINRIYFFVVLIVLSLLVVSYLFLTKNTLLLRLLATLSGNDGSNNYRIGVSINVFKQTLIDYSGMGSGIGMINTPDFIEKYRYLKLTVVVVNSFIYFMIESGVVGIFIVLFLIYKLLISTLKNKSILRLGIFVFIVGYQFTGSHFTSGLNWMLYGLILSDYNEHKLAETGDK